MNRDRDNNDGVGYVSRGGGHRGDYNRVSEKKKILLSVVALGRCDVR